MRSAPTSHTARATSLRHVSTLMTRSGYSPRTASTNPTTRRISSAASISAPGAALMPPMSTMSAPSSTTRRTRSIAASSAQVSPLS